MSDIKEVLELVEQMCEDHSIPKNVREVLVSVKNILKDDSKELGVKLDAAMQAIEGLSLDSNLSSYARAQIWNLTSMLSDVSG